MLLDILSSIGEFISELPRAVFGDRIDEGWGIAASIYVSVVAIAFVICGYRSVHELLKAVDIRFDKDKLDKYNQELPEDVPPRTINWSEARQQQVKSLRFTIPFGILVFMVLYLWVRDAFTLESYFKLTAFWLVFAMVLRVWWIATVVWIERKLADKEPRPKDTHKSIHAIDKKNVRWAINHYFSWGLQQSVRKGRPYVGLFKPLNPIVRLFRLRWFQVRLIRPLAVCTFYAFIWPLSTVFAAYYLTRDFEKRNQILMPVWAPNRSSEPVYKNTNSNTQTAPTAAA